MRECEKQNRTAARAESADLWKWNRESGLRRAFPHSGIAAFMRYASFDTLRIDRVGVTGVPRPDTGLQPRSHSTCDQIRKLFSKKRASRGRVMQGEPAGEVRQLLAQDQPTAVQPGFQRLVLHAKELARFLGRHALDVAQHHRRAIDRRQR